MFNYKTYILFLAASLVASIGIQMILPFPYGLAVALALFVAFPLVIRYRYMSRMGGYGRPGQGFGGMFGLGGQAGPRVKYSCMVCSHRYSGGSCPKCGSKMRRVDF